MAPIDEAMSPIKRALMEIRELRAKVAALEGVRAEPIAIVGVGLRFPGGVRDLESFEKLLFAGVDAISEIPADRWSTATLYDADPDAPGRLITRHGGFLDDVDAFDADFFGVSPREAESMDPQQRLVLEVAWEGLENAGVSPTSLSETRAGVYLGAANNDYGRALFSDPNSIDVYHSTGNAYSVLAGRISYFLGLRGPSMAVDTACSSSLTALHLACQGLRLGECDLALAGGVNLILTPEMNINFTKARMMAPDGRCKVFDAAADGYVRSEGCGVVVLRKLSDALAKGDRTIAVIRGSAVNQDGRSNGLTAPNGPSQESVIRDALAAAKIEPECVGYVESHGTGTPLGDPIEIGALGAALCARRPADRPLVVGALKSNFGHTESAAGVAGVLKAAIALRRGEIPPNLHFRSGSPHIDWSRPILVPTGVTPFPAVDGRRIAGVSSFGFSGTNVHVVMEAPPPTPAPEAAPERPAHLLALSARSEPALRDLAALYRKRLADGEAVADLCHTANVGRSHFAHRLAVIGRDAKKSGRRARRRVERRRRCGARPLRRAVAAGRVPLHRAGRATRRNGPGAL